MKKWIMGFLVWLLFGGFFAGLAGCRVAHDGTGKYVAKIELGYEVDEHKNAAHAVSEYTVVWPPAPPKVMP